jgi:hypothetical protein
MGRWNSRPIKHTLGYPMIARGMAFRVLARRNLGNVHDTVQPSFLGGLGEIRGGVDQSRTDRIDEIRSIHVSRLKVNRPSKYLFNLCAA